jgi:hypothetical protein
MENLICTEVIIAGFIIGKVIRKYVTVRYSVEINSNAVDLIVSGQCQPISLQ